MSRQRVGFVCSLGLAIAIIQTGCLLGAFRENNALAQITPDDTLGAERSVITPLDTQGLPVDRIDGGAIRGTNLFHSFEDFNVTANRGAYFFSPATIQNILARVTGRNQSQILGILGTFGDSNPNLFLINPNGIIFGQNARLNMRGSFVASTASSVVFADGTFFNTTTPQTTPLLTISVPIGLQFSGAASDILVQGSGLAVRPGRTLGLVGGNVTIEGGSFAASGGVNLRASAGRIEIGAVAEGSLVNLSSTNQGWSLGYEGVQNFKDIKLSQGAFVDASGEGSSDIQLQGRHITLSEGSQILAITQGSKPGGTFTVTASDSVELSGIDINGASSGLITLTRGFGAGGDLKISTARLIITDGADVAAVAFGEGQGGNLTVTASQSVEVSGTEKNGNSASSLAVQARGTGATGNLTIATAQFSIQNGGQVGSLTAGEGRGGNVNITASDFVQLNGTLPLDSTVPSGLAARTNGAGIAGDLTLLTRQLSIRNGAAISSSTFGAGNAGDITIRASDSVEVSGVGVDGRLSSGIFAQVDKGATGSGGNLTIETGRLSVWDGAQISAGTIVGSEGAGGNLTVTTSESVEVSGTSPFGQRTSGLYTSADATGAAGNLTIITKGLSIRDGAQVLAGTIGEGNGGILTVIASDSVELIGSSANNQFPSLLSTDTDGTGAAGDLKIYTGQLLIRDGAQLSVGSTALGQAGNLELTANSIELNNNAGIIATTLSGNGGNITLQVQDLLLLRHGSEISTSAGTAQQGGDGGNITINTPFIVAVPKEDSDISADAFTGTGGNIQITATGIYGIQFRPKDTPLSDITASSQFGIQGTVQINTPEVDPSRGLTNLPTDVTDASNQIGQDCQSSGRKTSSRFINTGRGGLPTNPYEPLGSNDLLADVQPPTQWGENSESAPSSSTLPRTTPKHIVEARGWMINENGEVVLVAEVPSSSSNWGCHLR